MLKISRQVCWKCFLFSALSPIKGHILPVTSRMLLRFGPPFVKRFTLCYRTVVLSICPVLSVCNVGALCPNGWMDQDETLHGGTSRPRPHCVRWERSSPQKREGRPPIFGPCLLWPNGWMDKDGTWYEDRRGLMPHCVRRAPSPPLRKGHSSLPLFGLCLLWPRSPISATADLLLHFRVSRRRREMYCGHPRLCVCVSVYLYVCTRPHAYTIARTRM